VITIQRHFLPIVQIFRKIGQTSSQPHPENNKLEVHACSGDIGGIHSKCLSANKEHSYNYI